MPESSPKVQVAPENKLARPDLAEAPAGESTVDAPPGRDGTKLALGIVSTVLGGVAIYIGGVMVAGPALQAFGGERCHANECMSDTEKIAAPSLLIGGAVALIGGIVLIKSSSARRDANPVSIDTELRFGVGVRGANLLLTF